MKSDPAKARAWQERSARRAQENRRAKAQAGEGASLARSGPISRGVAFQSDRAPIHRSVGGSPRRTPVKAVSAAKADARAVYAELRPQVLARDGYACQLAGRLVDHHGDVVPCGTGPIDSVLEVSHTIPVGRWAAGYTEPENMLTVCHAHGQAIHAHSPQATAIGAMGRFTDRHRLAAGWVMPSRA